ncbi:hypothetical protein KAURM247S_02715 [Kitasatospora aureofaciens]
MPAPDASSTAMARSPGPDTGGPETAASDQRGNPGRLSRQPFDLLLQVSGGSSHPYRRPYLHRPASSALHRLGPGALRRRVRAPKAQNGRTDLAAPTHSVPTGDGPSATREVADGPFFTRAGITVQRVLTGQRRLLPLTHLARCPRRRGHRPQAHPPLPPADQRQGRTLQPHPARRVGLRQALPNRAGTPRRLHRLAAHLQSPPRTHRHGDAGHDLPERWDEVQRRAATASGVSVRARPGLRPGRRGVSSQRCNSG